MTDDHDPVAHGIKEWDKVKRAAEAAIEEARKARAEAEYYRGQCELLTEQRKFDVGHIRQLQQSHDEMVLMIDALGAAVLSVLEKRNVASFRKAGSIENGNDRLRAAAATAASLKPTDIEESLGALARAHPAHAAPAAGH